MAIPFVIPEKQILTMRTDFSNIVWQSQSSVQPDVPYIQTLSPELPTFHILSPVLPCINFKFNNFRFKIPAPQTNAFAIINRN